MNKVIIAGNLGSIPELNNTDNGSAVTNVSLATNEVWNKDGEKQEHTEWHRLVFWGKQAESIVKWGKKGTSLLIDGRLRTREWEKDGVKRYSTEIHVNNWEFTGNKGSGDSQESAPPASQSGLTGGTSVNSGKGIDDDDLPF